MSRVHDALRRAEQAGSFSPTAVVANEGTRRSVMMDTSLSAEQTAMLAGLLDKVQEVPFNPAPEAHLIDAARPHEAPTEEFRCFAAFGRGPCLSAENRRIKCHT